MLPTAMENAENGDFEQDKQVISSSYAPLESLVLRLFTSASSFLPFRSVPIRFVVLLSKRLSSAGVAPVETQVCGQCASNLN